MEGYQRNYIQVIELTPTGIHLSCIIIAVTLCRPQDRTLWITYCIAVGTRPSHGRSWATCTENLVKFQRAVSEIREHRLYVTQTGTETDVQTRVDRNTLQPARNH